MNGNFHFWISAFAQMMRGAKDSLPRYKIWLTSLCGRNPVDFLIGEATLNVADGEKHVYQAG